MNRLSSFPSRLIRLLMKERLKGEEVVCNSNWHLLKDPDTAIRLVGAIEVEVILQPIRCL